jgi:hypothetical protein
MRRQIDIDAEFSRAIIQEIGERLQASFNDDELPANLKFQLDRLKQLDNHSSPSIAPETNLIAPDAEQLLIQETTTACNELRNTGSARYWRTLRRLFL